MLAVLALSPGRPVSVGTLIDCLWSPDNPERKQAKKPASTIQTYAKHIRGALTRAGGSGAWQDSRSRPGFYLLAIDPMLVDYHRFLLLADAAQQSRDLDRFEEAFARGRVPRWPDSAAKGRPPSRGHGHPAALLVAHLDVVTGFHRDTPVRP
ncbi:hypothetical protein ADK67_03410 [Saccharothrix sp. NRRL B-16348]|uniref:AfsR/SARP family transcriptional regulator n=1 Tax=Saccharothrix sp. NRRL B-16348 TaxID=1415542 RepID=UPI0006AF65A3|nr:hypothetical protein [Saccharothrix sp. NRRL B-16348]KOX34463.1 hypothetical protein ADK67_03410 [Saccharothrix sp. NRRL B-16348]